MANHIQPIHIDFALAYYVSPEPHKVIGEQHWSSPAGRETRSWLFGRDLIDREDEFARTTPRLEAWIKHLCSQPLPRLEWIVPAKALEPELWPPAWAQSTEAKNAQALREDERLDEVAWQFGLGGKEDRRCDGEQEAEEGGQASDEAAPKEELTQRDSWLPDDARTVRACCQNLHGKLMWVWAFHDGTYWRRSPDGSPLALHVIKWAEVYDGPASPFDHAR